MCDLSLHRPGVRADRAVAAANVDPFTLFYALTRRKMQKIQIRLGARFGQEEKRVASAPRRDPLVASVAPCWMIHPASAGTTSVPLQRSEGPARRVRCNTLGHPSRFIGHDKRAPPILLSEGPACQARGRSRTCNPNSGNNWRSVRIHGKLKILGELGRFACLMPIVGRANDTFLGEAEKALVHPNRGWNLERFTPQFLVFKRVRTDVRGKNYLESGRGER